MAKPMTRNQKEKLLKELITFLKKHECFEDVCIYTNGNRYASEKLSDPCPSVYDEALGCYVQENVDPKAYIEYANPDTLTMSYEGMLYHMLNYEDFSMESKLNKLFGKYGMYFEYGYAWSLSLYPND